MSGCRHCKKDGGTILKSSGISESGDHISFRQRLYNEGRLYAVIGLGNNDKNTFECGVDIYYCPFCGHKLNTETPYLGTSNVEKPSISTFTDSRDGKTYKTIKVGYHMWMAENLNYEIEGSKCCNEKYGRLYNWETANNASPAGWHLPSIMEWETLVKFVGGEKAAAINLKSTSGWGDDDDDYNKGTDDYGFSALPGGAYVIAGIFSSVGINGFWWSATEYNEDKAWNWEMLNQLYDRVYCGTTQKGHMFSVRCVQNLAPN